jgi:hypothetical protein
MATGNGSTTLRKYDLRTASGEWLGRVVIVDDGYFSAITQYGNYAYGWPNHGERDFRTFLCSLEPDYLCGKLSRADEYDGRATARAVKSKIVGLRRDGYLTKMEARAEWTRLDVHGDLYSREDFGAWLRETPIEDAHAYAVVRYPLNVTAFAERLWPVLREALRAEMSAEALAGAQEPSTVVRSGPESQTEGCGGSAG